MSKVDEAEKIEPLCPRTFVSRLESLTEAVRSLNDLKAAFNEQHPEYKERQQGDERYTHGLPGVPKDAGD